MAFSLIGFTAMIVIFVLGYVLGLIVGRAEKDYSDDWWI